MSDLYDDILDLQTGEKGQERLDIGDGNEAFLDWAIYYNYEGTCVTEDGRSPTEQLDAAFARVLDERRELEKAIDYLFVYRVDLGLDKQHKMMTESQPNPECLDDDYYMSVHEKSSAERAAQGELLNKTDLLESIAKWIHYQRGGGKGDGIVYCSEDPCSDAATTEELLDCLAA